MFFTPGQNTSCLWGDGENLAAVTLCQFQEHIIDCGENKFLEDAIQKMIFTEVHRLFVHIDVPQNIIGVLSLSDAARIHSGTTYKPVLVFP